MTYSSAVSVLFPQLRMEGLTDGGSSLVDFLAFDSGSSAASLVDLSTVSSQLYSSPYILRPLFRPEKYGIK